MPDEDWVTSHNPLLYFDISRTEILIKRWKIWKKDNIYSNMVLFYQQIYPQESLNNAK